MHEGLLRVAAPTVHEFRVGDSFLPGTFILSVLKLIDNKITL
jgi:hypothetical protein